jgi:hypothetical protein
MYYVTCYDVLLMKKLKRAVENNNNVKGSGTRIGLPPLLDLYTYLTFDNLHVSLCSFRCLLLFFFVTFQ